MAAGALVAALWTVLSETYNQGIGIWLENGLGHLLRYLVAVARLTYLLRKRHRHFEYLQPLSHDDIVNIGAVCAPAEWERECPCQKEHLKKMEDRVLFCGMNTDGERVIASVRRFSNHVAELWLALCTSDGALYTLPCSFTLDRSAGSSFSAAGLRLQCLAPNRRWRIAYNGLLRKHSEAGGSTTQESDVHVKVGLIWSTVSHTLEMPTELCPSHLASNMAKLPLVKMLRNINKLVDDLDGHDQAGMMAGELTVGGQTKETCLWGYKVRTQGRIADDPQKQEHHFGYLEDGDMYHLVYSSNYGGQNGISYGSVYSPSSIMQPLTKSLLGTQHLKESGRGRLHVKSHAAVLALNVKCRLPSLSLEGKDRSSQVELTMIDLECDKAKGSGLVMSERTQGPPTRLPTGKFRHKIVQETDVPVAAPLVSDIHDACSKVPELTGGKGSSLAVLQAIATELGTFSVPRGFVVTTKSYELQASNKEFKKLLQEIENSRTGNDGASLLKEACSRVVAAIEDLEMPEEVHRAITEKLAKFPADTRFAVRSSALGEDSEDMSAAGQMTTLLGLEGQEKILRGVVRCWASQFSFTNVNYKRQYGQPLDVPMAVVVQELVDASSAGVMFTCDPLTGNPALITVTANYGLGESVVSASADPDTFVLKRVGEGRPHIESLQLGRKSVYTASPGTGGVVTLTVEAEKAQAVCISHEDVERLAHIGVQIEKTYTTPQDIEWAIRENNFFMLQCRPVTTIFRESDCEMIHEFDNGLKSGKEILSKANLAEVLPGATSPLSLSFLRVPFEGYCREEGTKPVLAYNPDPTQYVPLWMPVHRYNYFLWFSDGHRNATSGATLMDKAMMYSIMGRDTSDEVQDGVKRFRTLQKKKVPLQLYCTAKMMLAVGQGLKEVAEKAADLRLCVDGTATSSEIYEYIACNFPHIKEPAIHLFSAALSSSIYNLIVLQVLAKANGELNNDVFSVLSKILQNGDVESAQVPRMIQELGSLLRKCPEKEKFLSMSNEEASKWLSTAENECGEKFREFIEKHGHRSVKEFDVYTKPWAMDSSSLVKSLKAAARAPEVEDKSATASWEIKDIPYRLTMLQRLILKLVIPKARIAVAARETSKSAVVRVIHQLRLMFHQLSLRMVHEGRLPDSELLFFLTFEEIGHLLRTRSPELVLKAQRRKGIHAKLDMDRYPSVFVGVPHPIERTRKLVEGDFEIKGNPMSQGVAEGRARVAPTFEEAHLIQKGEILITTATDTGWTPYFPLLAGVVTEIGGPLSHGAVVAREYGLPCVVGIEGITSMLATGDYIQLDGNTGVIRKISPPATEEV
ncbi:rifampicin phosphotransferase-like isoform X1 [Amblyomma americanum]